MSTRRRDCAFTWQKKDTDTSMLASLGFRRIDLKGPFINDVITRGGGREKAKR